MALLRAYGALLKVLFQCVGWFILARVVVGGFWMICLCWPVINWVMHPIEQLSWRLFRFDFLEWKKDALFSFAKWMQKH